MLLLSICSCRHRQRCEPVCQPRSARPLYSAAAVAAEGALSLRRAGARRLESGIDCDLLTMWSHLSVLFYILFGTVSVIWRIAPTAQMRIWLIFREPVVFAEEALLFAARTRTNLCLLGCVAKAANSTIYFNENPIISMYIYSVSLHELS